MTETTEIPAGIDPMIARNMMTFDPFSREYKTDPYAVYRQLREEQGPIGKSALGVWTVVGYDECATALKDPHFGWGDGGLAQEHFYKAPDGKTYPQFNFMDPPYHTRMRQLVGKIFSPARSESMRATAESMVNTMMDKALAESDNGEIDLISAVAGPMPALVLSRMLGVPGQDEPWFRELCRDIERGLDLGVYLTPEQTRRRDDARKEMYEYFGRIARMRRENPGDDLISDLVRVEDNGDINEYETRVNLTLLLTAGYVTMINMVGNGLLALMRHPDQMRWLQNNPHRVTDAFDELTRYDGPGQMVGRVVLQETELGGHTLKPGEPMMVILGSANRDPKQYPDPDTLDLNRPISRHLGFGLGIHYCIGQPLSKVVSEVGVGKLVQEYDLELAGEPVVSDSITIRGHAKIPARVTRRK